MLIIWIITHIFRKKIPTRESLFLILADTESKSRNPVLLPQGHSFCDDRQLLITGSLLPVNVLL